MRKSLYAFPRFDRSVEPLVGLAQAVNGQYPEFIRIVVDGGAGVGDFTAAAIDGIAGANVIGFEPLPENATVLRSRFGRSPAVDIRELAIGDRAAIVPLEVRERAGIPNSNWEPGTSPGGFVRRSLPLSTVKTWAKRVLRRGNPDWETVPVRMERLDSQLAGAPDLIKLDLQGGEPAAIAGLGNLLSETKVVKFEVTLEGAVPGQGLAKSECVRALRAAGFRLFVEDFLFAVPDLTQELRAYLTRCGATIEREKPLNPSNPLVFVQGRWPQDRPLPIESKSVAGKLRGIEVSSELADLLSESDALFFGIDLIALNGRYGHQWKAALPEGMLERGEI